MDFYRNEWEFNGFLDGILGRFGRSLWDFTGISHLLGG